MNVPKLRFKEFTDKWQKVPLNLFTNIYGGYAFKSENLLNYKAKYQVIKMGNVNNNTLNLEKNPSYLNTISQKELPYLLEKNDIILTLTGTFGKKDFGYSYQIKNETNLLLNQRLAVFKITNSNYSANFLKYILLNNTFLNKFFRFSVGGTGNQANVSIQDIKSFKIPFPKLEEQNKIANFLSTVDKKITNLENTITSLENQKEGLLQQIFSQKLRFKDKNGNNYPNWEKKKLGDIGSFSRGGNLSKSDLSKKGTSCILYGELYTYYNEFATEIKSKTLNTTNLVLSKKYDVLLPLSGETAEDISTCTCIFFDDIALGSDLLIFRSSFFDGRFMSLLLKYKYKYKIAQIAQGKSIVHISEKNIKNINIKIPCIEEQQNIADFILIFTKKLENQKAQLEHWKQIKKGLLQQMFV